MSHRSRSRTADSADSSSSKKSKGTPRRLTEKIAMMRKREHQQSEAFNEAMKSIFEMQQARIHPGGGSMPSLAAIDSTPPNSIDMQSVFKDFNEVKHRGSGSFSGGKERPHSGGTGGRSRLGAERRGNSMDTDPYPPVGSLSVSDHHYWNASPEWMEGDLSRHKSDSDLQQSLMMQGSPQHLPHPLGSPQQQHRNHKLNPPGDLGLWKRPNSMTSALLSPDQYSSSEAPIPSPLGMTGAGTASSSLPDLTNIEFSSGLDVPLEHDDATAALNDQKAPIPGRVLGTSGGSGGGGGGGGAPPFHSPTTKVPPVPSQLVYSSFQAQQQLQQQQQQHHPSLHQNSFHHHQQQQQGVAGGGRFFTQYSPPYGSGLQQPVNHSPLGLRQISPLTVQSPPTIGGMVKSPTMPDFKTLHACPAPPLNSFISPLPSVPPPAASQLGNGHGGPQFNAQFLPSSVGNQLPPYRPPPQGVPLPNFSAPHMMGGNQSGGPPPMTIIIQPPPTTASNAHNVNFPPQHHPQPQQNSQNNKSPNKPPPLVKKHQSHPPPLIQPDESSILSAHSAQLSGPGGNSSPSAAKPNSGGAISLPNTPVISLSSGLPVLPSYIEAKQQQALQERFASINVNRQENMIRSHSEENLQKAQKEKGDLMHNPFMGTLANANSVPCVYVEATNMENQNEGTDSPTPGDSPSTSASYASSPPSVRPYWADHSHSINEFVFHEWPLEGGGSSSGGGGGGGGAGVDRSKMGGSPPVHHKSLTDLNTIPEIGEFLQSNRNRQFLHQLSLPSVAMTDLAVDDMEKQSSPTYFMPSGPADFEMEDEVMDNLLKNEVPDLEPFMISDGLMTGSPESFIPNQLSSNY